MIIAMAADHGGFELKNDVKKYLETLKDSDGNGYKIVDLGTNAPESVDYPIYGKACARAVADGKAELGLVFCGSGIGISIAANRIRGVRCALVNSVELATLAKKHNNANMLAMGGRFTSPELARQMVDAWLKEKYEGGRHNRRIALLDD
ncbi:MAG: ribose 5-phosphate isomerase B [Clostridiales bacterium]|nr:ribose 5-phosphate isomerase B [Clostridiales bacterium]MDD7347775.1 ribose 5-phosphate isomerase B [Clostridiales bacterium]MDY4060472.1 ribose 5-phosphate isomerase B [Anaerovoracaceae bacterium]